jgi:hypothetical protein
MRPSARQREYTQFAPLLIAICIETFGPGPAEQRERQAQKGLRRHQFDALSERNYLCFYEY